MGAQPFLGLSCLLCSLLPPLRDASPFSLPHSFLPPSLRKDATTSERPSGKRTGKEKARWPGWHLVRLSTTSYLTCSLLTPTLATMMVIVTGTINVSWALNCTQTDIPTQSL